MLFPSKLEILKPRSAIQVCVSDEAINASKVREKKTQYKIGVVENYL